MTSRGRSGARSAISSVSSCSVAATSSSLVHVRDERFAHRIGDLEQDLAVAVGLDQVPDDEPLLERQRLQDVGDVRRMQAVEVLLQLDDVLLLHQVLDQLVARPLLPADEPLHDLVPAQ